jgi:sialic acid synthase SpsE
MRIIAEVGNVDLVEGFRLADALAGKCWGYKVQLYDPEFIASPTARTYGQPTIAEPVTQRQAFADPMPYRDAARLKDCVESKGMVFLASVFDLEALRVMVDIGCEWVKVASGEITNWPLLEAIAATDLKVILSTGASTIEEVDDAVEILNPTVVMACTLSYPTPADEAHLERIRLIPQFWPLSEPGYSDHTRGINVSVMAEAMGAMWLEKHVTIRRGEGGDHDFAVTPDELAQIHETRWWLPADIEERARIGARRSWHYAKDLRRGSVITDGDLILLRPGDAGALPEYPPYGVALDHDVTAGDPA